MISEELLMATQRSLSSMPAEEAPKISVSLRSYAALEIIVERMEETGKDWQPFPDIDPVNRCTKYNSLSELVNNKQVLTTCQKGGDKLVRLCVPWERIIPSKNGSLPPGVSIKFPGYKPGPPKQSVGTTLAIPNNGYVKNESTALATIETKESGQMRVQNNPISRGGYKPTFHIIEDFVKDVRAMATLHSEDQFNRICREMNDVIRRLPLTNGGEQDKLIETL